MNADPRSIVTPDAFSVTPELLGTPLAEPWRRFVALLLDLVLIAFLQLLGWRVLGGIAALMLLRMATRRPDGTASTRGQRFAMGCAGTMVFVVVIGVTVAVPPLIRMLAERDAAATVTGGDTLANVGGDPTATPPATRPLVLARPDSGAATVVGDVSGELSVDTADAMPDDTTIDADDAMFSNRAADSIAALIERVGDLEDDLAADHEVSNDLRERLDAAESRSTLFTWIRDAADEAGLIFGWGTVYLTLFLALWQGRTPGKKAMGLRVVRLNGQPLGLYMSLERAGGYMAGLATGLLGFAQMWWDPNRQAIHDKIAETVVIRERMPNRMRPGTAPPAGVAEPASKHEDSTTEARTGGAL